MAATPMTPARKAALERNQAMGTRAMKSAAEERKARGKLRAGQKREDGTIVLSRSQELERGIITVHDLDDAELARRQCYNAAGTFVKRPFTHSPRILAAMDAELLRRGENMLRDGYTKAVGALANLLDAEDPRVRVQAIDRIMERVSGKVPDKLISADVTPHSEASDEIASALAKALGYSLGAGEVIPGEATEVEPPVDASSGVAAGKKTRKRPRANG